MKRTTVMAGLAFAALSGSALAQTTLAGDISVDARPPLVSGKSRAEVRAEFDAFRKTGVDPWAQEYNPLSTFTSSKSRAQVSAQAQADARTAAALYGEDSGSSYLASTFSGSKTRANVTATYLVNRESVAALTGEDSGSRYLSEVRSAEHRAAHLADRVRAALQQ